MRKLFLAALALAILAIAAVAAAVTGPSPDSATAASHREAPGISLDPAADHTDVFFFRSYEAGKEDKVVMIMNVLPGEEPSAGPTYYNFDPSVRYAFGIDNNADGKADDVTIEVKFEQEIRGVVAALGLPLSYVGNVPPPERGAGAGSVIPPITALDGPGSEGLGLRQSYSVTMIKNAPGGAQRVNLAEGRNLFAVPSNVGPRTMPNYDALAAQGMYDLGNGVKVFAGQRNDPFYIDLGAVFDTLNLRRFPPLLSAAEDASPVNPFGFDQLQGFSVHTIAIEMPASMLTSDGRDVAATSSPLLGLFAKTSRPALLVQSSRPSTETRQVSRMANPLVNELIIPTAGKDRWNASDPDSEESFLPFYLAPRLGLAFELVFGFPTGCTPFGSAACSPNPPAPAQLAPLLGNFNRDDLVNILLKYRPTDTNLSELLRLNLGVAPRPLAAQSRLGILGGDTAGYPNGRRPKDDVVDITIRVVGGPNYITNRAGDGVNSDFSPLPSTFPFIARPSDGRNLNPEPHVDPTPGS